jgi:hypothetical protein
MWLIVGILVVIAIVASMATHSRSTSWMGTVSRPPTADDTMGDLSLRCKLDEWIDAGLIDADNAAALEQYESEQSKSSPNRVPLAAEAVGYIGGGLVLAAVALLVGGRWSELGTTGRIAALAVPTTITLAAGWWSGHSHEPALQRLGSVLWLLTVAGAAAVAAVVWIDAISEDRHGHNGTALFIGAVALGFASPMWWFRKLLLQQMAMFGAAITIVLGVVDSVAVSRDATMTALSAGISLFVLGGAWCAAGLTGRLIPTLAANVSGAVFLLIGAQIARNDDNSIGLWLGLGAAIALMTTGVAQSEISLLLVGTLGLFQWAPQMALFYLEDSLGAEATLLVIGAILLVFSAMMTRLLPRVKAQRSPRMSAT